MELGKPIADSPHYTQGSVCGRRTRLKLNVKITNLSRRRHTRDSLTAAKRRVIAEA
jgi:hypothetical protein